RVREWLETHQVKRLNVAGPRASKEPMIYQRSLDYLRKLFQDSVS
ncbi:MAG: YpsA SLOG family protein, partial [Pirellula sp.]